jgi:hypothetical protein
MLGSVHRESHSQDSLPVCLWKENPNRLVSLWEMLKFHASRFVALMDSITVLSTYQLAKPDGDIPSPTFYEELTNRFRELEAILRELELRTSAKLAHRIVDGLEGGARIPNLKDNFDDLRSRVRDELEDVYILALSPHEADLYESKQPRFGDAVNDSFPSTILEIEEAGKCLALGRSTASVFHLMRVMESGLRALGKSLNEPRLDPKKNPSWENILRRCDDELQKPQADRSAEWKTDPTFFADATANMRAVKDAWRNPTMHVEIVYDPEKAEDVWNAVKAFMRHLAGKLKE